MKKKILAAILIGIMTLAVCGCGKSEEIANDDKESETKLEESISGENMSEENASDENISNESIPEANMSEGENEETTGASGENENAFSFNDLKDIEFYFTSGAGGWMTTLTIESDGSFSGEFFDGELGLTDVDYPNGTMCECYFYGQFTQPVKVNNYTYSMQISELNYTEEVGKEEIRDGMLYIYTDVYGLDGAEDILIYLPGAPLAELTEEFRSWVGYYYLENTTDTELPFYALNNEAQQYGFYSHIPQETDEAFDLLSELAVVEQQAVVLEDKIYNEAVTQLDMNEASGKLYELWDNELNLLWGKLVEVLSDEEMLLLVSEEREWIEFKSAESEAAGAEFEGGSMQPMMIALKEAELTRDRVYVLAGYLGDQIGQTVSKPEK